MRNFLINCMLMLRLFCLLVLCQCFLFTHSFAQQLTTQELITAWKADDTSQTTKAEATYYDLRINKNLQAYNQRCKELDDYLANNPSKRLEIRIDIYKILGKRELDIPTTANDELKLKNDISTASLINDKQLLSEIYTLYAVVNNSTNENFLLYLMKAIDIQHHIGDQHFPLIFLRYMNVSLSLYSIGDYRQSISYGLRSLQLMHAAQIRSADSVLQLDMIGASYKALNKPDSTIYYYKIMQQVLTNFAGRPVIFRHLPISDSDYVKLWSGIAAGGIAQGLVLQKKYDEAYPLLLKNIASSVEMKQFGDASIAQNTLAQINFIRKQYDSSLYKSKQAYSWGLVENDLNSIIPSLKTIADNYKALGNFDSAYYYIEKYHSYQDSLEARRSNSLLAAIKARVGFEDSQTKLEKAKTVIHNTIRTRNYLLVSIVLLTIIALLLYNRYRLKQILRREQLEKEKALAEAEVEIAKDKIEDAQIQIEIFSRHISEKNKLIENLQSQFGEEIKTKEDELRNFTILTEEDWQLFKSTFEKAYPGYLERLSKQMNGITQSERRFMALAKIGLSNKEIAAATGISPQSIRVTIFRLKKKFDFSEADDIRIIAGNI